MLRPAQGRLPYSSFENARGRYLGGMSPPVQPGSDEWAAEREAWTAAGRVAQAAHSLTDLATLVNTHEDFRVRCEAIPRLRARFPGESQTLAALSAATRAFEAQVREAAVDALGDLGGREAADLVAARMTDTDREVRAAAGEALAYLRDPRAPADIEDWRRRNGPPDDEVCGV